MIRLCIKGSREEAEAELQRRGMFSAEFRQSLAESTLWNWSGIDMEKLTSWFCEVSSRECEPGKGFPPGTLLFYKEVQFENPSKWEAPHIDDRCRSNWVADENRIGILLTKHHVPNCGCDSQKK